MAEADPTVFKTMLAGGPYQASDEHVQYQAQVGRDKVQAINEEKDGKRRMELFKRWANLGGKGNCYVALPFFCEYVFNLTIGDDVYIGPGNTFLDVTPIKIGDGCQIGPSCHFYTPGHPVDPEERRTYVEWATPITLEHDVWLGGNVTVLGGVTIGHGSTVGAGSVVTKSVPPRSVVVGNPARVIRTLPIKKEGEETEAEKRRKMLGL